MKLKIKVTKETLRKSMMCGVKDDNVGENCAIALAVREIFPKAIVGHRIYLEGDIRFIAYLPIEAKNFIRLFDSYFKTPQQRLGLPELKFEIKVPEAYLETVDITELTSIINQSQTLELV